MGAAGHEVQRRIYSAEEALVCAQLPEDIVIPIALMHLPMMQSNVSTPNAAPASTPVSTMKQGGDQSPWQDERALKGSLQCSHMRS